MVVLGSRDQKIEDTPPPSRGLGSTHQFLSRIFSCNPILLFWKIIYLVCLYTKSAGQPIFKNPKAGPQSQLKKLDCFICFEENSFWFGIRLSLPISGPYLSLFWDVVTKMNCHDDICNLINYIVQCNFDMGNGEEWHIFGACFNFFILRLPLFYFTIVFGV